MSIVARNDQQVAFKLVFEDKFGNAVTALGSVPAWSVGDENLATIEVAEDGFSAVVKSTGKAGTTQVSVLVDSDPGAAEEALVGTAEITFVAGKAVFVRLTGIISDAVATPIEPETPVTPVDPAPGATGEPEQGAGGSGPATDEPVEEPAPEEEVPGATAEPAPVEPAPAEPEAGADTGATGSDATLG